MKKSFASFIGLALTMVSLSAADTQPQYVIKDGVIMPADSPAFRTVAAPRQEYGTEHYIAVWGAANFLQTSDENKITGYGESENLSLKSDLSFAAGLKFGQIWNLDKNGGITVYGEKKNVTILPSIEGEFIYAGNSGSKMQWDGVANVSSGDYFLGLRSDGDYTVKKVYQKFDMDIYALMLNPIVRVQWGRFRPYVGFGVGGAYVTMQGKGLYAAGVEHTTNSNGDPVDTPVSGKLYEANGDDSLFTFAFQGLAGTDVFLSKEWSLFLEYKFLGLVGMKFDAGYGLKYNMGDVYGNHLVGMGVKYHY